MKTSAVASSTRPRAGGPEPGCRARHEGGRLAGDHDSALDSAGRALRTARTIGSRDQESRALWALGDVHAELQDQDVAHAYRRDCLTILQELARIDPESSMRF